MLRSTRFILFIAFIAFISLGLPDGLIGVAWPTMRLDFGVRLDALGLLTLVGVSGYVVSTVLSGKLVARLGIGRLLALSCGMTAVALTGYTIVPSWLMLLPLIFVAGFGGGAIDAGINTYMAEHYRGMLFLLHAMFGIGTTSGPLIMTAALNLATWRAGYWVVAAMQFTLAVTFFVTAKQWEGGKVAEARANTPPVIPAGLRETLRFPRVWLSVLFFFVYTGVESGFGQWAYSLFTLGRGVEPTLAGLFISIYWGAFTFGRAISGLIVKRIPEGRYLQLCLGGIIVTTFIIWINPLTIISLLALPLLGFALAPIFPSMTGSTSERVGARHTPNTIGFQIGAAATGAAIIPGFAGVLGARFDLDLVALVFFVASLVLAALYIAVHQQGQSP